MSTPTCSKCGGPTKAYDRVKRILKDRRGVVTWHYIYRYRCLNCGCTKRILPDTMLPFKHYSKDIIDGVVNGLITEWTYGFEDYPCLSTIKRWRIIFARK